MRISLGKREEKRERNESKRSLSSYILIFLLLFYFVIFFSFLSVFFSLGSFFFSFALALFFLLRVRVRLRLRVGLGSKNYHDKWNMSVDFLIRTRDKYSSQSSSSFFFAFLRFYNPRKKETFCYPLRINLNQKDLLIRTDPLSWSSIEQNLSWWFLSRVFRFIYIQFIENPLCSMFYLIRRINLYLLLMDFHCIFICDKWIFWSKGDMIDQCISKRKKIVNSHQF